MPTKNLESQFQVKYFFVYLKISKHLGSSEMLFSKSSSASNDFVSADVNEALQEARQIVTEGRARYNPNERLIDDATTIKVTHQGTRNDPIEVTVRRSRIVSQPNTDDEDEEKGIKLL